MFFCLLTIFGFLEIILFYFSRVFCHSFFLFLSVMAFWRAMEACSRGIVDVSERVGLRGICYTACELRCMIGCCRMLLSTADWWPCLSCDSFSVGGRTTIGAQYDVTGTEYRVATNSGFYEVTSQELIDIARSDI